RALFSALLFLYFRLERHATVSTPPLLFFRSSCVPRGLPSFPTRRSSDLMAEIRASTDGSPPPILDPFAGGGSIPLEALRLQRNRSEEHTSELQSRENLVCRLLLEKKN